MANKNVQGDKEVLEALNKSEAFFDKNKKTIIGAVAALLVIVAAVFAYNNYVAVPKENKASTELAKAQELFNMEQFDDKTVAAFQKVINDYSGTDAANLANLYLGLCYANQEKWADAVKYLDKYDTANDAMVSPAAVAALGNAYANTGNIDKAVASLKKAASMADKQSFIKANYALSATFLIQAGQLLESQNKNDEALTLYKEIKSKYVNAQQVQSHEIDKYIERLQEK